jgi:hypothetical protein
MTSEASSPAFCGDDAELEAERERFLREFKSQFHAQQDLANQLRDQDLV